MKSIFEFQRDVDCKFNFNSRKILDINKDLKHTNHKKKCNKLKGNLVMNEGA